MNRIILFLTAALFLSPTAGAVSYVVTDSGDSGPGTLRDAVAQADDIPGLDTITFNLGGVPIILDSDIQINDVVLIDGGGTQVIEASSTSITILKLSANSDGSVICNLALIDSNIGIDIESSNNHIYGCRIGTNWQDQAGLGNGAGIYIFSGNNNLIGGSGSGQRNVISGNINYGICLDVSAETFGNCIQNNFIGVNSLGTAALSNKTGIEVGSGNIRIGGNRLANEGNLISENWYGINIMGGGNTICGNVIGLNAAQDTALPNSYCGIHVGGNNPNFIGLPESGYENIIAGNENTAIDDAGIRLDSDGSNIIQNNWIGFNELGTQFSNGTGIRIIRASGNIIGGNGPYERNYICETNFDIENTGIGISSDNNIGDIIEGNWIGVLPSGNLPSLPASCGIYIGPYGSNNYIERNIVFGTDGICLDGNYVTGNTLTGNWIGVLPSGNLPAMTVNNGIKIKGDACNNFIGIKSTGNGNLIANVQNGIVFDGTGTNGNGAYGNTICAFSSAGIMLTNGAPMSTVPVIEYASNTQVAGTADSESYIEVFRAEPRPLMAGGSLAFMGSTTADDSGNWRLVPQPGFAIGDYACALATDVAGNNTSLFSVNKLVFVPTPTASPTFTMTPTITPTLTITSTISYIPRSYFKILYNQINPIHGEEALIRWSQPHTGPVTITIYTLLGSKIITLKNNQTYSKGQYHEVKWDGKTREGKIVGSGIYIVFFQANGHTDRGKIAVVK